MVLSEESFDGCVKTARSSKKGLCSGLFFFSDQF